MWLANITNTTGTAIGQLCSTTPCSQPIPDPAAWMQDNAALLSLTAASMNDPRFMSWNPIRAACTSGMHMCWRARKGPYGCDISHMTLVAMYMLRVL